MTNVLVSAPLISAAVRNYGRKMVCEGDLMARYLVRTCPRCNGYVGIVIREPGRNVPVQAVNGRCNQCSYRMAWIVIGRKRS
jgi:hypothetical protein